MTEHTQDFRRQEEEGDIVRDLAPNQGIYEVMREVRRRPNKPLDSAGMGCAIGCVVIIIAPLIAARRVGQGFQKLTSLIRRQP